jgi:hypothetical protein
VRRSVTSLRARASPCRSGNPVLRWRARTRHAASTRLRRSSACATGAGMCPTDRRSRPQWRRRLRSCAPRRLSLRRPRPASSRPRASSSQTPGSAPGTRASRRRASAQGPGWLDQVHVCRQGGAPLSLCPCLVPLHWCCALPAPPQPHTPNAHRDGRLAWRAGGAKRGAPWQRLRGRAGGA